MFETPSTHHAWSYHHAAAMGVPISALLERSQHPRDVQQQAEIARISRHRSSALVAAWQLVTRGSRSTLELVWSAPRPEAALKAGQS